MNKNMLAWAAMTSTIDGLLDQFKNKDTSKDRKARKAKARELSIKRAIELKQNPRNKKRRKK